MLLHGFAATTSNHGHTLICGIMIIMMMMIIIIITIIIIAQSWLPVALMTCCATVTMAIGTDVALSRNESQIIAQTIIFLDSSWCKAPKLRKSPRVTSLLGSRSARKTRRSERVPLAVWVPRIYPKGPRTQIMWFQGPNIMI